MLRARFFGAFALSWVLSLYTAAAFVVVPPLPANFDPIEVGGDGDTVTLNPGMPVYLPVAGAAQARMHNQLAAEFPGWTFVQAALPLNGSLLVDVLEATIFAPHVGGLDIEARYMRAATDPPLGSLRFAQLIDTNFPLGGPNSPYIDPRPNDDFAPFYWTFFAEHALHENGGVNFFGAFDLEFLDEPRRSCRRHPDFITWRADLFLTELVAFDPLNQVGTVYIYDGVRYGFDFMCVPEPAAIVLILVTAAAVRRR